ncbi:MAG: hydroxymethylbilane synthase [Nitrospinota bacterium]
MADKLIIATRKSPLALWQANFIKEQLLLKHDIEIELLKVVTQGDKLLDLPLSQIGGKSLFVKELESALLDGKADLAVHSLKDVAYEIPDSLAIATVCKRTIRADVLVSNDNIPFNQLREGATIGSSSLRRQAQLLNLRPDLNIVPLRGNVGTRLAKLKTEPIDAIVLAEAGLVRLGLEDTITEHFNSDTFIPAAGQGALAIETRIDDIRTTSYLDFLNDPTTMAEVEAERAFVERLGAGCQAPIGASAKLVENNIIHLTGIVGSVDGKTIFKESLTFPHCDRFEKGRELATRLLAKGADKIIDSLKVD